MTRNYEAIPSIIKKLDAAKRALAAARASSDFLRDLRVSLAERRRVEAVKAARDAGMGLAEVGEPLGLSAARVNQLEHVELAEQPTDLLLVTLEVRANDEGALESRFGFYPTWLPAELLDEGYTFVAQGESAQTLATLHRQLMEAYKVLRAAEVGSDDGPAA